MNYIYVQYNNLWMKGVVAQAALVLSWSPCHWAISSFNTSFTNLCCLIMGIPLNCELSTVIANIEPQPPEMSLTCKFEGSK